MSPVGGVGINLAIQDAVAAANALSQALRTKQLAIDHLRRVQRRRELPTRVTQRFQVVLQNRIISRVLKRGGELKPPFFIRMLARFPVLRRVPARLIGIGSAAFVKLPISTTWTKTAISVRFFMAIRSYA
jgi:2-polyprenyl-6-methoxyphenol hydroxylase-like FAD-dependent oxidoreductase